MLRRIKTILTVGLAAVLAASSAYAVLPNIFATQPAGNVPASLLDTNFTFLESQGVQGLTTTGSSNAYVATPADAWVTGYSGYISRALTVKPSFTNSGAATINVSGLGAASIYKNVGGVQTALIAGDIVSGTPVILICDGTGFLLVNSTSGASTNPNINIQAFTALGSNNWTSPSNLTSSTTVKFTCTGAGAGGGSATGTGGGGGAGSTAVYMVSGLGAGTNYVLNLGSGGLTSTGATGTGSAGGNSTITIGATTIIAPGGNGGAASGNSGRAGLGGGACTNATTCYLGGDGTNGAGGNSVGTGGVGGASHWGGGGLGGSGDSTKTGGSGEAKGSGGGGSINSSFTSAGAGANGYCEVEWVL